MPFRPFLIPFECGQGRDGRRVDGTADGGRTFLGIGVLANGDVVFESNLLLRSRFVESIVVVKVLEQGGEVESVVVVVVGKVIKELPFHSVAKVYGFLQKIHSFVIELGVDASHGVSVFVA